MPIKLIALDMDGTTLDPDHHIRPQVAEAIHRAQQQGIHVVLASGRPFPGIHPYLKQLDLATAEHFAISNSGALVHRADDGRIVVAEVLSMADYLPLQKLADELNIHCHVLDAHHCYTSNLDVSPYTVTESYLNHIPLLIRQPDQLPADLEFAKFMFVDEPEKLRKVTDALPKTYFQKYNIAYSSPYFLEVFNKHADKGIGVKLLAEQLGITASEVMCIGDHENDLPMIRYAGIGVAMGNAIPSVKEAAQYVTLTNNEDGVAHAIEKFALTR